MRIKTIYYNGRCDTETFTLWDNIDFVPPIGEYVAVKAIIPKHQHIILEENANCWSGYYGVIDNRRLSKDDQGYYYELFINCEDL